MIQSKSYFTLPEKLANQAFEPTLVSMLTELKTLRTPHEHIVTVPNIVCG